jgi:hypothetical protein
MLQPLEEKLLNTFDELLDSDYKIKFDDPIHTDYQNNPKYQKAFLANRIIPFDLSLDRTSSQCVANNMAWSQPCKYSKHIIDQFGDGKSYNGLYQIPEVNNIMRENLFVAPFHPYLGEFQRIMDWSFEAGLPVAWEQFYVQVFNKFEAPENRKSLPEENLVLYFSEISPFFLILVFGFLIALFVFLCEIAVSLMSVELREKFANLTAKSSVNVTRIEVKPKQRN